MSTRLRIAAAAAAALTLAPAVADAAVKPTPDYYNLEYVADVSYRHVRETDDADNKEVTTASFHLRGEEDRVEVLDGQLHGPFSVRGMIVTDASARFASTTEGGTDETCSGDEVGSYRHGSLFPGRPAYGWPANEMALAPFMYVEIPMTCSDSDGGSGTSRVSLSTFSPRTNRPAPSRFHIRLKLPEAGVKKGSRGIEWSLRRSDSGKRDCPGRDYYTRVCTTTVDGWLRLTPAKPPKQRRGRAPSARGTR
ncbi:hypothetical protein Q5424_25350 [Conexibacter sp. JD483]|uniref:hypothetical protein n=1 Tax=unclassified Conexibacter TaxID=2627773 RepID=UPI00271ADA24|nr:MULTISPECIES: hypothetical protein [unclassified Conexibacter]MDO8189382.1 hypothetical protein [Conexibacter sp. CPCC 205706]MDO8201089.1 hypothetical protein [Conexibacter sp. CPCC 205762]MDR9372449.1 hypothetical protein [Conexibacter sp. JD483]